MLTLAILLSTFAQPRWPIPMPRAVPDPAKLTSPQPSSPVESTEHLIGTISASSQAKTIVWILPSELELDTRKLTDGKSLYFTGPVGEYRLFEVAVNADSKAEPQTFERRVTIKRKQPPGPVPPVPPGPPDPLPPKPPQPPAPPVIPDGPNGLTKLAYTKAMEILEPNHAATCKNLAAGFRAVASAIAAGAIKNQADLNKALNDAATNALGENAKNWKPFQQTILARVGEVVAKAGLLAKLSTVADCLKEVAAGLELVGK